MIAIEVVAVPVPDPIDEIVVLTSGIGDAWEGCHYAEEFSLPVDALLPRAHAPIRSERFPFWARRAFCFFPDLAQLRKVIFQVLGFFSRISSASTPPLVDHLLPAVSVPGRSAGPPVLTASRRVVSWALYGRISANEVIERTLLSSYQWDLLKSLLRRTRPNPIFRGKGDASGELSRFISPTRR